MNDMERRIRVTVDSGLVGESLDSADLRLLCCEGRIVVYDDYIWYGCFIKGPAMPY
jgi:hypothetical protein